MGFGYSAVGLNRFLEELKQGLDGRVNKFHRDILEKYKNDTEALAAKTRTEWTKLFQEWCKKEQENRDLRKLAEDYILGNMPE